MVCLYCYTKYLFYCSFVLQYQVSLIACRRYVLQCQVFFLLFVCTAILSIFFIVVGIYCNTKYLFLLFICTAILSVFFIVFCTAILSIFFIVVCMYCNTKLLFLLFVCTAILSIFFIVVGMYCCTECFC